MEIQETFCAMMKIKPLWFVFYKFFVIPLPWIFIHMHIPIKSPLPIFEYIWRKRFHSVSVSDICICSGKVGEWVSFYTSYSPLRIEIAIESIQNYSFCIDSPTFGLYVLVFHGWCYDESRSFRTVENIPKWAQKEYKLDSYFLCIFSHPSTELLKYSRVSNKTFNLW